MNKSSLSDISHQLKMLSKMTEQIANNEIEDQWVNFLIGALYGLQYRLKDLSLETQEYLKEKN